MACNFIMDMIVVEIERKLFLCRGRKLAAIREYSCSLIDTNHEEAKDRKIVQLEFFWFSSPSSFLRGLYICANVMWSDLDRGELVFA